MIDAGAPVCSLATRHAASEINPLISKFGHGGPRPNSGGPRPGAGRPRNPAPNPWAETNPWIGPRWCVIQTYPQAERLAARELSRSGYRCYLPLIATQRRDPVIPTVFRRVLVTRFAGYAFVELAPTDPWIPVRDTAGVARLLLTSAGRPAPVATGEVERHMAEDGTLCDLSPEVMPTFNPGAHVRIETGAMSGLHGTVVECDGLVTVVSLTMFGREVQARLARTTLAEG